jgi:hypothetical protein
MRNSPYGITVPFRANATINKFRILSRAVVVNLIGSTQTRTGLRIQAELDTNRYESGIKVTDDEMQSVRLKRDKFHGDWNYGIEPHSKLVPLFEKVILDHRLNRLSQSNQQELEGVSRGDIGIHDVNEKTSVLERI